MLHCSLWAETGPTSNSFARAVVLCFTIGKPFPSPSSNLFLQTQPPYMPSNSPLHFSTSFTIMYSVNAGWHQCVYALFRVYTTAIERKLIKAFMLGSLPHILLLHTREMWATKQTFYYKWCWKQVASVKAWGNFHKNKVILYWSYKEKSLSTSAIQKQPWKRFSVLLKDTCRNDLCQHGLDHQSLLHRWELSE